MSPRCARARSSSREPSAENTTDLRARTSSPIANESARCLLITVDSLQQLNQRHAERLREALHDADRRIVLAGLEPIEMLPRQARLLGERRLREPLRLANRLESHANLSGSRCHGDKFLTRCQGAVRRTIAPSRQSTAAGAARRALACSATARPRPSPPPARQRR